MANPATSVEDRYTALAPPSDVSSPPAAPSELTAYPNPLSPATAAIPVRPNHYTDGMSRRSYLPASIGLHSLLTTQLVHA